MKSKPGFIGILFIAIGVLLCSSYSSRTLAASWQGIEPFKSRRADVLKILGQPISETTDGVMRFNVAGGSVQVSFVNQKFVTNKKLSKDLEGTVLEIVLQHVGSTNTPESMKLLQNKAFIRDDKQNVSVFRNPKDGIVYTFIDGTLKTTRYTFADEQLARARR